MIAPRVPTFLAFALGVTTASTVAVAPAHAQQILAKEDFLLQIQAQSGASWAAIPTADAPYFFGGARCACATPVRVAASLSTQGLTKRGLVTKGSLKMMVGTNCTDKSNPTERDKRCQQIGTTTDLVAFAAQGMTVNTTVNVLVSPKTGACDAKRADQTIWLLVDFDPNDDPDLVDSAAPSLTVTVDTEPPKEPAVKTVAGGNEALIVDWSASETTADLAGYQVFCSRGEDLPVFKEGTFANLFMNKQTFCPPGSSPILAAETDGGAGTGADAAVPFPSFGKLKELDPAFMCSGALGATETSHRVSILQNGIPYLVGVVAVDRHGNPSALSTVYLQTPTPSRDFYRGYCAAAGGGMEPCPSGCELSGGPSSPLTASAYAVVGLGLASLIWLRRRRP